MYYKNEKNSPKPDVQIVHNSWTFFSVFSTFNFSSKPVAGPTLALFLILSRIRRDPSQLASVIKPEQGWARVTNYKEKPEMMGWVKLVSVEGRGQKETARRD